MSTELYDVIIIGTGAGGGTLAYDLATKAPKLKILLLERGDFLPKEPENWSPEHVFLEKRYKTKETWRDKNGAVVEPGMHYFVGGNTKFFGGSLVRLRREDFQELNLYNESISSPAWPISYDDLAPYYDQAEELFNVHGAEGEDPTEPSPRNSYPAPPIPHDDQVERLSASLAKQGFHPIHLPLGVDWEKFQEFQKASGNRGDWFDGYPCHAGAKSDAETCAISKILHNPNVKLRRNALVKRLIPTTDGSRIEKVEAEIEGGKTDFRGRLVVVSCGAVNSAALLLRSKIANSSGCVGRYYMAHLNTTLMAVNPFRKRKTHFQKTLTLNDFYFKSPRGDYPLGNVQLIGKLRKEMLQLAKPQMPAFFLNFLATRSLDWWVLSEDLPLWENRVEVDDQDKIQIHVRWTNREAHQELVKFLAKAMRRAGYPFIFTKEWNAETIENCSHQVGTVRFGHNSEEAVLDQYCRSHDVENLFVVDGSFFPSSGSMNPALTIMAQALRVGEWIRQNWTSLSDSISAGKAL